ncbi:MAG: DUF1003 domain-containing protein [Bacteroidota bacterium]|jgi:uncharacterized membrane protein
MKNANPVSTQHIIDRHITSRNVNIRHKERLSRMDKLAIGITKKVGSMGFFMVVFTWTAVWLAWNTLAPVQLRFDPFPAFVLWLFISNMLQIFLMPLIMVGQNLQSRHAEIRAEEDYLINKKAELEIETILTHLENQDKLILQILAKMEKEEK